MIAIGISLCCTDCWHVMDIQEPIPSNLTSICISCIGSNSFKLIGVKRAIELVHKAFAMRTQIFLGAVFCNWNVKYLYRSSGRTLQMAL